MSRLRYANVVVSDRLYIRRPRPSRMLTGK